MVDFSTLTQSLAEFSRCHCVAICAFLVPANLLVTLATMILAGLHRPRMQVWRSATWAAFLAIAMVLHVWTWFAIGVVMAPTFILLALAAVCLLINGAAIVYHHRTSAPDWSRSSVGTF